MSSDSGISMSCVIKGFSLKGELELDFTAGIFFLIEHWKKAVFAVRLNFVLLTSVVYLGC